MALYRCAACGSPNVVTDTQAGGIEYNYLKGAVGTVVLGAGGAAAGIGSKQQRVFKCPDCGMALSYPMQEEVKKAIDLGVIDADARDNLTVWNVPVTWDYLIGKYKHIEEGAGDAMLKIRAEHQAKMAKIQSEINRDIADSILKDFRTLQVELALLSNSENNLDELQAAWEITAKDVLDARQREYDKIQKEEHDTYEKAVDTANKDIQNQIEKLSKANDEMTAETEKLQTELPSLGLFKGKRKKEINERLRQIEEELVANKTKANELAESIVGVDHNLLQKRNDDLAAHKARIDKEYPLGESPAEHKRKLLETQNWLDEIKTEKTDIGKEWELQQFILYRYIEYMLPNSETRIKFGKEYEKDGDFVSCLYSDVGEVISMLFECFSESLGLNLSYSSPSYSDPDTVQSLVQQKIVAQLKRLCEKGVLCREEKKYLRYYYIPK